MATYGPMTALEALAWLQSVRVVPPRFRVCVGQELVFVIEAKTDGPDGRRRLSYDVASGTVIDRIMENWDTSYRVTMSDGTKRIVERWHVLEVRQGGAQ